MTTTALSVPSFNIADRMREAVELGTARVVDQKTGEILDFAELDQRADALARGLIDVGLQPGDRVLVLVKPSCGFFCLIWALFRAGLVPVLVDPAMGLNPVLRAVTEAEPRGAIALQRVLWFATLFPRAFRSVKVWVRAEPSGLGGMSLRQVEERGAKLVSQARAETGPEDLAAVLFTSGSTGAPKGVRYTHRIFESQRRMLGEGLGIEPGEVDLSAFPLFSLFSMALGASVVVPDMDSTKPALVDPAKMQKAFETFGVTYAFGSPAFWARLVERDGDWPLRRALMAGAPAPPALLEAILSRLDDGADVFTPYGATESLPICLPSARQNRAGPVEKTLAGAGTWVGRPLSEVTVRIAPISDDPTTEEPEWLPPGQVGEIWVSSPVTTAGYFRRPDADARTKVVRKEPSSGHPGAGFWHRMGDLGYRDETGDLWFCGRQSHRIETETGPLYPVQIEAMANREPRVRRTALVGRGPRGQEKPWLVIEPRAGLGSSARSEVASAARNLAESHPSGPRLEGVEFKKKLPVDARHNAKIRREVLKDWIEKRHRK